MTYVITTDTLNYTHNPLAPIKVLRYGFDLEYIEYLATDGNTYRIEHEGLLAELNAIDDRHALPFIHKGLNCYYTPNPEAVADWLNANWEHEEICELDGTVVDGKPYERKGDNIHPIFKEIFKSHYESITGREWGK